MFTKFDTFSQTAFNVLPYPVSGVFTATCPKCKEEMIIGSTKTEHVFVKCGACEHREEFPMTFDDFARKLTADLDQHPPVHFIAPNLE